MAIWIAVTAAAVVLAVITSTLQADDPWLAGLQAAPPAAVCPVGVASTAP